MFESTRLKLTSWYLLIIMLISISFSVGIYRILSSELINVERMQRVRQQLNYRDRFFRRLDPEVIIEAQNRIKAELVLVNFAILAVSAAAGYFLAGKTLQPIKEMVDEQNRFITDASHELRTPLTSLKSEIEVGLRDKSIDLKEAKRLLMSNLEEVNSLTNLSDNLMYLTQYQARLQNKSRLDLQDLLLEAQRKVQGLSKLKKIKFKNDFSSAFLFGNRDSLVELFVILYDNAIKYSPIGTSISSLITRTNNLTAIEIEDQGMGIKESELSRIFDRFYRVDLSRAKSNIPGFGLGLSIAKQIVEVHQGSIEVKSQENKGTTFILSFQSRNA